MTSETRYYLSAPGLINALGAGVSQVAERLFAGDTSGMVLEDGWLPTGAARVGRARALLPEVPDQYAQYACRNNQLLLAALAQIRADVESAIARFGPRRIGVVLGTSTSGISEGEAAVLEITRSARPGPNYHYLQQEIGMPAPFLARFLGLQGPAFTVSTACTSSAKAFASARNLLRHGLCDVVLVGGADSLCRLTVCGFAALESTTTAICNPMSRNRSGINIGEGAALFMLTRDPTPIELLGIGETSDAHHMSAPHPDGRGAQDAMLAALADASLAFSDVDYLNLHATATPKNDEMESRAVARVFADGVATSGTKPLTGHTLGTAGATELAFCWLALQAGRLPPHVWDGLADPALPSLDLVTEPRTFARADKRVCMSNSFAFGGSNACLLIGDAR